MNTQNQDNIIDRVGAKDWKHVVSEFAGATLEQIKSQLDEMFYDDDNEDLADEIYSELN